MRTLVFPCLLVLLTITFGACSPTQPAPVTDLQGPATADMSKPTDLTPPPPAASLTAVSPATVPVNAATDITITGVNCHFDQWYGCATISFAPCDVPAYTTLQASTAANSLRLNVQTGKQAASCNLTIQPRAGQPGSCGAALGPPLTLSPAFSLQ